MTDGYEIDLDRAPQALANLELALDRLQEARRDADELSTVSLKGSDSVSTGVNRQLQELVFSAGEGSLFQAMDAYQLALEAQIDNLRDSLAEYHTMEEMNSFVADEFVLPEKPLGPTGRIRAI